MATVTKCDFCAKVRPPSDNTWGQLQILKIRAANNRQSITGLLDLCPDCGQVISSFITRHLDSDSHVYIEEAK